MENTCKCDMPQRWTKDPKFPIEYDALMNEYYIRFGNSGKHLLFFCPECGGKMPQSKRGDFFTDPDEGEVQQITKLLRSVTDVASMRSTLGEPDLTFQWSPDEDYPIEYYPIEKWKTQYTYSSKWNSVDLCICEKEDGTINYFWYGKEKSKQ